MAIVNRDEGSKINSRINVTPMVDVMLVLLIIFMVIMPLLHGPEVQLARTNNPLPMPDADKDDALLVAINKDGKVFLGAEEISPADLGQKIQDRIAGRTDRTVFVRADARSRYGTVAGLVDKVRAAGVNELGLLTERRPTLTRAPGPVQ